MRIIISSIFLIIGFVTNSQTNYVDLINKYEKLDMYGSCFFDNVSIDRYIKHQIIDSLLGISGIKQVIIKQKPSGLHIRKSYWTEIYDSNGLSYKNYKYKTIDTTKTIKQFDNIGNLLAVEKGHFKETYKYDDLGNIIEINKSFNTYTRDSTGFRTMCYSFANKWKGLYDTKNRLISEETHWNNGNIYKASYEYLNGVIKSANHNALKQENLRKEYIYENGLLIRIDFYNIKGRRIRHQKIKWTIKKEA
jgi:YD repeat-containing protein